MQICAVRASRARPDKPRNMRHIADLDGAPAQAIIAAGGRAPAARPPAAAAATTAVVAWVARVDSLGLGRAEGQLVAVLRQVGALRALRAVAHEFPLVGDIADLNTSVGGRAAVGAERASFAAAVAGGDVSVVVGIMRGREGGDSQGEEGGEELHFQLVECEIGMLMRSVWVSVGCCR